VNSVSAVIIGGIAGVLVVLSVFFVERTLKVDDPVGAVSVHGTCGAWGVLSLGLFADGVYGDGWNGVSGTVRGLFYGDSSQFLAQCVGTLTCAVFVFISFYLFFKFVEVTMGNRVSASVELEGLDIPEMGAQAYPDFVLERGTLLGGATMSPEPVGTKKRNPVRGDV
jgi:ammonium transporter, Amt family